MRSLDEKEKALKMHFHEGRSYQYVAKTLNLPLNTVKSWCLRYRKKMGIERRDEASRRKETVREEDIHSRTPKTDSQEDRIARLEMEVDLLRNFLILAERG
jgi:DNA-directed RNA polymerase specialized sigma24 family protein